MRHTQLYISRFGRWNEVDMYDDADIAVNYSVSDIRDISSKTSTHSLTVTLPNTPSNGRLFDHIHEMSVDSRFLMMTPYECKVVRDGSVALEGVFEMQKVTNASGKVTYEGVVYSSFRNIADILGDDMLRGNSDPSKDIDFSDMDLTVAQTSLANLSLRLGNDNDGVGLCLVDKKGMADGPNDYPNFYADELTPFLKVKDIFDRIIARAGYQYNSKFISGNYTVGGVNFARLAYPFPSHNSQIQGGDSAISRIRETDNTQSAQIASYSNTSHAAEVIFGNGSLPYGGTLNFPSSYSLSEENISSTLSAYKFVTPVSGSYRIKVKLNWSVVAELVYLNSQSQWIGVGSGSPVIRTRDTRCQKLTSRINISNSGGLLSELYSNETDLLPFNEKYTAGSLGVTLISSVVDCDTSVWLDQGDVVSVDLAASIVSGLQSGGYLPFLETINGNALYIDTASIYVDPQGDSAEIVNIQQLTTWGEDSGLKATNILNPATKQIDFLTALFRQFNLFCEDIGNRTLRIEPYSIYYSEGKTRDWSDKVDHTTMAITVGTEYLNKRLDFKHHLDNDANLQWWKENKPTEIGEKILHPELSDTTVVETAFSTAIMKKIQNVWLPMVYSTNDGALSTETVLSDRIMTYGVNENTDSNVRIFSRIGTRTQTPSNYTAVSCDLLKFDANAYNAFYRDMLQECGKILTCKAYISTREMSELKLSDTIIVDSQRYHINAIREWTSGESPCEVELIRLL